MSSDGLAVLIVDDSQTARAFLCDIVEEHGYRCFETGDPRQVCAMLAEHDIRVLLLDVGMPERSGLEVLGDLKNYETQSGNKVYSIIVTGSHDKKEAMHALMDGAFLYLNKPVQVKLLVEALEKAAGELQAYDQSGGASAPVDERSGEHDCLTALDEALAHVKRPEGALNALGYPHPILLTTNETTYMHNWSELLTAAGYGVVCIPELERVSKVVAAAGVQIVIYHVPLTADTEQVMGLIAELRGLQARDGKERDIIIATEIGDEQRGMLLKVRSDIMAIPAKAAAERLTAVVERCIKRINF